MLLALLAGCGDPQPGGGGVINPNPPPGGINWGAPTVLASNLPGLGAPAAAFELAGLAAVLWTQPDAGTPARPVVAARVNTAATGWAAAVVVEQLSVDDTAGDSIVGLQAEAPNTGIVALWARQRPSTGHGVRSADREAGGWSPPQDVPVPVGATVADPVIAANAAGVQAAAWVQDVGGVRQVVLSVRRVGAGGVGWSGAPIPVQTAPGVAGSQPALAVDPAGVVMILWRQGNAPGRVLSRTYDAASGQFGGALLDLNPPDINDMRNPRTVALGSNSFVATWEQVGGGGLYSVLSKPGTAAAWQGTPAELDARTDDVTGSRLLVGPNQSALALWQQAGSLFIARLAAGQWSQPAQIGAGLAGTSSDLRAAVDASGNAIAAWLQRPAGGGAADLYAVALPSTAASLTPGLVETDSADASAPALSMNAAGAAVVAWLQAQPGQTDRSLVARVLR